MQQSESERFGLSRATSRRAFVRTSALGASAIAAAAVLRPDVADAHALESGPNDASFVITGFGASTADTKLDNQNAINAAIDAAVAVGGGVVYVPDGIWRVNGPITMKSHVWLRGVSMAGAILRVPAAVAPTVVINLPSPLQGTVVENLTIDAIGNATALATPAIRYINGGQLNYARAIRITNSFGIGIQVTANAYTSLQLRDIHIVTCEGNGLDLAPSSASPTPVMVAGLQIDEFGTAAGTGYGVRMAGRCQLSQIEISSVGTGNIGIAFQAGTANCTVTNYFIRRNGGTAFGGASPSARSVGAIQ